MSLLRHEGCRLPARGPILLKRRDIRAHASALKDSRDEVSLKVFGLQAAAIVLGLTGVILTIMSIHFCGVGGTPFLGGAWILNKRAKEMLKERS